MRKLLLLFFGMAWGIANVLAQTPLASLPFEVYGDHIFIKLKVNNSRDLDFIFDTGDGLTVLNIETARELNMVSGADATTTSAEGTIKGKLVKHQRIEINDLELKNLKIYETSLGHLEISIGRDIDGIIGYDVLRNYVVSVNYDNMKMEIYDPSSYRYSGNGKAYPVKIVSQIATIPAMITLGNGEKLKGNFFLNTGAKTTVDFNTPFVESNALTGKVGNSFIYLVAGLGNKEYEHHEGRVSNFEFGDFSFSNLPVGLSHAKSGLQNNSKMAGIIGGGLLRKFNIVYNFGGQKIFFEKAKSYDAGFEVNASGIELQLSQDKSKVLIHKVFDNSPASAAGIKMDTELNEVNGTSAVELGLAEIRRILKENGKNVELKINGKALSLELKSLI